MSCRVPAVVNCCLVHAAVGQAGIAGRQATGVFANEAGRSGWSQLADSVIMHPPLAHQPSPGPTSQSQPPALLQSHHTAGQQQTPHLPAHQPLQQALPPAAPEQLAQPAPTPHGLEFQYDSFSDSVGDGLMPEAASQALDREDHTATDEPAQAAGQESVETPGQAVPAEQEDPGEPGQQHEQQAVGGEQQQRSSQHAVLPQTDGAGDSDSVDSQDPPAQHAAAKLLSAAQQHGSSRHVDLTSARPDQQPAELALQADQGLGEYAAEQHRQPLVTGSASATVVVQRPRRRRNRHVVQHAVRLAAAARNAMDSVAVPAGASSVPLLPGNAPGHQSEPQLPAWLHPQAAADRQFQSEPQLPQAWTTLENGPEVNSSVPPSSAARQGQGQGLHPPKEDSQHGGMGRHGIVTSHQVSQSTVAAAAGGSAPHIASQVISDSKATSDLHWQQRHHYSIFPRLQQSQRLESQVVSDSRATSDLRWAQHGQTRQALVEQQAVPSQDSGERHGFAATHGRELAWEQPASAQATVMSEASGAVSEAALGAASGAASGEAAGADDMEIVISDSQPSPVQQPSRSVYPPTPTQRREVGLTRASLTSCLMA